MDSHVHEAADSRVGVERVEEVSGLEVVPDLGEHKRDRVRTVAAVSKLVAGIGDHLEAGGQAGAIRSVWKVDSCPVFIEHTNMWSEASPAGVPSVMEMMRTCEEAMTR